MFTTALLLTTCFSPATQAQQAVREASKAETYQPTEGNLEARRQFRDDRFGVFIHWGIYSVLGDGEWVMNNRKMTVDEYEPLAKQFNPTKFDAAEWVTLFKNAGAKYITITSKHHDGFAMWDSEVSDYNIVDATPYGKDVLKQLADECAKQDMKLFFYHSHLDWRHPDYYPRGRTGKHSGRPDSGDFDRYLDYMDHQLTELLDGDYGDVAGIWFDGWWDQKVKQEAAPGYTIRIDWRLRQTYDLIHRLQPDSLIGNNHHVAPFAGEDFQMFERDLPGENTSGFSKDSVIGSLPLETCDTTNGSWGYKKSDQKFKSTKQLVHYLVNAAGRDANLLLNVGPLPDGTINPQAAERLRGMGEWLANHESSVRGTRGGPVAPQPWGVTTYNAKTVYLHILDPAAVDSDGWLPLSGTEDLPQGEIRPLAGQQKVESRRTEQGLLEVKLAEWDPIDTVLTIARGEP